MSIPPSIGQQLANFYAQSGDQAKLDAQIKSNDALASRGSVRTLEHEHSNKKFEVKFYNDPRYGTLCAMIIEKGKVLENSSEENIFERKWYGNKSLSKMDPDEKRTFISRIETMKITDIAGKNIYLTDYT